MASEIAGTRKIDLRVQDIFTALATGNPASFEITEDVIAKFCTGCDVLGADGVCYVCKSNDQARYVARGWCGWALVNGKRGEMTFEGFKAEAK